MHDADPASTELLLALLRRPPGVRVLVASAMRSAQIPPVLADRLGAAQRDGGVLRVDLGPLDPAEALALIGAGVPTAQRAAMLRESGGNPFYVEQLVRAGGRTGASRGPSRRRSAASCGHSTCWRGGCSRAPRWPAIRSPDLAAAAAQLGEHNALELLDGLLATGLVRETGVPRQFTFRHPLVRRAVYEGAGGGWRLAVHARVAAALERRGAAPEQLAHHVDFSAPHGDEAAVAILRAAGDAVRAQTPATAARWYAAALRLLTGSDRERRRSLLEDLAGAESAAGRLEESRRMLLEALVLAPERSSPEHIRLVAECAAVEHWLGRHDDARRRLRSALDELGDDRSAAAGTLELELGFDALYGLDFETSARWAQEALAHADRGITASATALLSMVRAAEGRREEAERTLDAAIAATARLSERELAGRLDALWYLAWAETFLDRFEAAVERSRRALELSRASGQERLIVPLMLASVFPLEMLGRITEAVDVGAAAVDAARLSGNPHHLSWALWEYGLVCWYGGNSGAARVAIAESQELADETGRNILWEAMPGWALSSVQGYDGELAASKALTLRACGGAELPLVVPAERCIAWDLMVMATVGLGQVDEAEAYAARMERDVHEVGRPLAGVLAKRARASVLLERGDAAGAVEWATAAVGSAYDAGIALERRRSQILLGRALAAAGERQRAIQELRDAELALDAGGALMMRDEARRELRKLGHRVDQARRRGAPTTALAGMAALSSREREVVALVAAGRTNPSIAAELFLSVKTVETHLRNVFVKLGVASRAEVAAAFARGAE